MGTSCPGGNTISSAIVVFSHLPQRHRSLVPTWFDPDGTQGITPYMLGSHAAEPGSGRISDFSCTAPYEELTQKTTQ